MARHSSNLFLFGLIDEEAPELKRLVKRKKRKVILLGINPISCLQLREYNNVFDLFIDLILGMYCGAPLFYFIT